MAVEPWRTGTVIRVIDVTYNTKRYFVKVDELERFNFKPGQFVTLDLPIHEQKNKRWRSYSIASWPDGSNIFELLVVLLEGGAGSTYLFNEVKEGSQLMFRGAQGVFTLPEVIDRDLFLVCTGTGIAPFRSMANHIKLHNISFKNIYLIFGCRTQKDLLYPGEMYDLQQTLKGFKYLPTLSREEWDGYKGYVHAIYEEICKKNNSLDNDNSNGLSPAYFYLCGWKAMIDEAKSRILELGYDRKAMHLELYG